MIQRQLAAVVFSVALAVACAAAVVAMRNYRSMHSLLEADPPSPLLRFPHRTAIAGLESVSFSMSGGIRLAAWYAATRNGAAVVLAHGTNSDRSTLLAEMRMLADAGYGVLAFDWPGLGESGGEVRWDGQARGALSAAIDWLSAQPGVDPRRIGGLGYSIGGFVMVQVAARDPRLRAVVLEAPLPDLDDYIRLHHGRWGILSQWPAHWAIRGSGMLDPALKPLKVVEKISPRPVLMLAGSLDKEVPPVLVTMLFRAAREPKGLWIVEGAQHGGYGSVAADEYTRRVLKFFSDGLGSVPKSVPGFGKSPNA